MRATAVLGDYYYHYNSTRSRPCNCRPPYAGGGAATGEHNNTDKGGAGRTALGAGPGSNSTELESSSPEWQLPRILKHDDTLAEPASLPWPVAGALQRLRLDGPDCGDRASGEGLRMFTEDWNQGFVFTENTAHSTNTYAAFRRSLKSSKFCEVQTA